MTKGLKWIWCAALAMSCVVPLRAAARAMERIIPSPDDRGFVTARSTRPFHPWGLNYGNRGRLMEDFWDTDWKTLARDFGKMKALGANVVRVHLQFGKFMAGPNQPRPGALRQLGRMLRLAEKSRLYLDVTGLACYRPADIPAWYDSLDEPQRWVAQSNFWSAVAATCAPSPAVFCYDLINEPLSPGSKREPGHWGSGALLGSYDFLQFITLDPKGRQREEVAVEWIRRMSRAIRDQDKRALVTVGLLPWSEGWQHLSGFVPEKIASELDFISVHIYPDAKKPEEAMEALRQCAVGKPVVIEETFPLSCSSEQEVKFLLESKEIACGWLGHYDGFSLQEYDRLEREGKLTAPEAMYQSWEHLFKKLKSEFAP